MSTRGMIGIRINGNLMGTYNHFDSYPDGLGNDMVTFIMPWRSSWASSSPWRCCSSPTARCPRIIA